MTSLPVYRDFEGFPVHPMPTEGEIDAHNAELARLYRIEEAATAFLESRTIENGLALENALAAEV
jgi:hypothetical protein